MKLKPIFLTIFLITIFSQSTFSQNSYSKDEVLACMKKATHYMIDSVSYQGGFVWNYLPDFSRTWGEMEARRTMVWIQPPGTPSVGHVLLDAYHATGDEYYYQCACKVAGALIKAQLPCGGWNYVYDMAGEDSLKQWYQTVAQNGWRLEEFQHYYGNATFDDSGSMHSAKLLLRLYVEKGDTTFLAPLEKAIGFVLNSQYPSGGWPQRYPLQYGFAKNGKADYSSFITLNDEVLLENIEFLTMCYQVFGREELKASALKAMYCLKNLQQGKPYAGWSDQYTTDLKPAHARSYEPRAINTATTIQCANILMDFYQETGDTSFLSGIPDALAFVESEKLPDDLASKIGRHPREEGDFMVPRFIDPDSGKPLYVHRLGSNVVNGHYYTDQNIENTIGHYSSQAFVNLERIMERYKSVRNLSKDGLSKDSTFVAGKPLPRFFTSMFPGPMMMREREEDLAKWAIDKLDDRGRWMSPLGSVSNPYIGSGSSTGGDETKYATTMVGDLFDTSCYRPAEQVLGISTSVYIHNMMTLIKTIQGL